MKQELNFPDHSAEEYEKHLLAKQKAKEKREDSPELTWKIKFALSLGFTIAMVVVVAFESFFDSGIGYFSCLIGFVIILLVIFKKVK